MIDAYLDESGIHEGAEVCVIAGYFGGKGQWREIRQGMEARVGRFRNADGGCSREEFAEKG
jgi:hypothetical protein